MTSKFDSSLELIIVDVLIAVLFDPPHMYLWLCHVCTNKARKKNISLFKVSLQSLFFLPTLAQFWGNPYKLLSKHCWQITKLR
jgi:hypothetical protein